MSGGELRVDYDALDEMAGVLRALKDQLDGMRDDIGVYREHAGHDGVSDKMDWVAKNWSDDRREIVDRMEEVATFGEAAAQAYREADQELADEYADVASGG